MAEIENLKIGNGGTLHIVGNEDIVANAWQAGKTYVKNKSYVIREHRLYVCNVTHTSVEPFDATNWTEITVGEAIDNALDMTDTASGAIATFDTSLSLPLQDCTIAINAVQESGTPTPSSPKAISGFTGANVTRCGVNLMHVDSRVSQTSSRITYTSDDNYIYLNGAKYGVDFADLSNLTMTLPSGTYYLKAFVISGTASKSVLLYAFDGTNNISPNILGREASMTLNKTTTFRFRFNIWSDSAVLSNYKIGIVISKTSISEYSEYNGSIYNIAFTDGDNPLTVYGGTLDVTSGVLTVNRGVVDMGSLAWQYESALNRFYALAVAPLMKLPGDSNIPNMICSQYLCVSYNVGSSDGSNNVVFVGTPSGRFYAKDSRYTSASDFKRAMDGVTLVYELATPVTYQLTPTQINTIVGTNNVFTDTNGDTSLEYYTKRGEQTVRIAEDVAVDVINNKNINNLTTTNKTLVGAVNEVNGKFGGLPTDIRCGIANYSGLKGGGHANRVNVPITFSSPMSGTQYAVFIVISDAYQDYPYIQGYCFAGSRTANGFTATLLSMSSDTTTEISGSFYWVAVRYK